MRRLRLLTPPLAGLALGAAGFAQAGTVADWRVLDPAADRPGAAASEPVFVNPAPPLSASQRVAPFVISGDGADRQRATDCLTSAIYYEAANEPRAGQEAVAQVVLNRVRHPLYPKSVCGVVYEGAGAGIGCQFTFACDGSLARHPVARLWNNAREVAEAALAGHVADTVGASTHYHAYYVSPAWRTTMVRTERIGAHIFYRMPGARGIAAALTGRYSESEPAAPALILARATATGAAARHAPASAERSVDFTVWGIKMATISVKGGRIDVKSPS
ncbi:MAG: cell wall hydrolase [Caulobacteraceae bacterium]